MTISFRDGDGALIARCIGRAETHDHLSERLQNFLFRNDWQARYAQWLASVENMALRSVVRRSGMGFQASIDARSIRRLLGRARLP